LPEISLYLLRIAICARPGIKPLKTGMLKNAA